MREKESFEEFQVRQSQEIAERWLDGEFGPRGPYTQVTLTEEQARAVARTCLHQHVTLAEAVRLLIDIALSQR